MDNLNYGVIGNCCTAALISEKGSIEWLCFPNFDSPSIFAALLDREKGGTFGFEVSEDYHTIQSYVPHTNILSTTFVSEQDEFAVVDFMPCYELYDNKEYYRPAEVYRYIRWIKGRPRIKVNYHPAPDYARGKAFFYVTSRYIETYSSSNNKDRQYLYSSLPLQGIVDHQEFILEKDEFFLLSYNEKVIPVDIEREKLEYCRTLVYWLNWTDRTRKFTIYNDIIERSLLTLKMMSFYNGAVLASLTTSLPEAVGEVRNWDYRFCWLRDASMSIETLFKIGHADAARVGGHIRIVTSNAIVSGIAHGDHAHAVFLGLLDSHFHGLIADDLTHAVMAVHNGGGGGFLDDFKVGHGELDTGLDAVQIDGLEAIYAVGLDAALVGLQQHVRANFCILFGNAVALERIHNKVGDDIPADDVVLRHN